MDSGLEDKVVLITGASGGIGSSCAYEFASEKANLILHGKSNMEKIKGIEKDLSTETLGLQADLTKKTEVRNLFQKGLDRFGKIDVVVANAGIWPEDECPICDMELDRWNNTIATDLTSVFLCAREFFKILERTNPQTASLVILGSTAAVFGEENHADYSAAKAGITYGLTRSLKNEITRIVPEGRVNAVCPGWTKTQMAEPGLEDKNTVIKAIQTRSIKKIAQPEDIARTIVFLASHRLSGHLTGEIVTVSGGMEGRVLHQSSDVNPNQV